MTISRIKEYPYPHNFKGLPEANAWARKLHTALTEEASERLEDFDILKLGNVPIIDVRKYGVKLDGTTDDTIPFQATIDDADTGSTVLIPEGTLKITSAIAFTKRINLIGTGAYSIIHNTGTENAFTIGTSGTNLYGLGLRDFHVYGGSGTLDALHLNNVHSSSFENIIVGGTGNASFYLDGCLMNSFTACHASINAKIPGTTVAAPVYGFVFDILNSINSNANVFNGCSAEGITSGVGVGFEFINGYGNIFNGGATEGNTVGLRIGAGTIYQNTFNNVHFETNGTDATINGGQPNFNACYGISPNVIAGRTKFNSPSGFDYASDINRRLGTAAPTTGTWTRGSIVWNSEPSAGGTPGWMCVTAGTPGTWKAMASVAA